MRDLRSITAGVAVLIVMTMESGPAQAQNRVPAATGSSESIAFRPQGLPAGGFRLYPVLRASVGYDDNIARSDDRRRGDGTVVIAPTLTARSNWTRHLLNAEAFYRDTRYFERTAQNNDEYGVDLNGRLDVMRTTQLSGSARYSRLAEQRGTPGDLFLSSQLIKFDAAEASGQLTHRFNRVAATIGVERATFRYDDVTVDGATVDQGFRNRDVPRVDGRLSYQYSAVTSLFVSGTYNRIEYNRIRGQFNRSSQGLTALAGIQFEFTRLLRGSAGVGYLRQNFTDARFPDFSGINYNVSLNYKPTTLTSLSLTASRRLTDSALREVAGVLTHDVRVNVEHELLRNLLLQGFVGYSNFAYRGLVRNDNRVDVGLGARYRMNRTLSVALSASRVSQDSADTRGRRFDSNRASMSLVLSR